MYGEIIYCENCRDDVEYLLESKPMSDELKGTEYHYNGQVARCPICGQEIYVPEVQDFNLIALYDEYRRKNGIVSRKIIQAVPEKYAIGKRPLSLLLGWGEQTYSRFCEGDVPTRQYSEIITRIYEDPSYYSELLEAGKDKLKSQLAYKKSRKATDMQLGNSLDKEAKIDKVAQYLLYQCEDITPLALQKALYYIQGFYYAFYGNFLFEEDCEAWVHGPVYCEIFQKYRNYQYDRAINETAYEDSTLTEAEKTLFDSVVNNLCCYSGKVLEQFTHHEDPWKNARGDLPLKEHDKQIIPKETIGEYFLKEKEKYRIHQPKDIQTYARNMFEKIYQSAT